jgi:predicted enzyme related to lactoylglutathione lyase
MGDRPLPASGGFDTRGSLAWPNWIGVVVDDLDEQRRFWSDLLGPPVAVADMDYVQFDLGSGRVFELLQRSAVPQYDERRFQVGFAVEDIQAARQQLIQQGAEPISEIVESQGGASAWAYFRDPEGNVFEITQRGASPSAPGSG